VILYAIDQPSAEAAGYSSSRTRENKEVEEMNTEQKCNNCGEDLGPNLVRRGEKVYCCEACAFEARRSVDCGGRADSHITQSEPSD